MPDNPRMCPALIVETSYICKKCAKRGVVGMVVCPCNEEQRIAVVNSERSRRAKIITFALDERAARQELGGEAIDPDVPFFDTEVHYSMFEPRFTNVDLDKSPSAHYPDVYIAVDPSGGGDSEVGICIMVYDTCTLLSDGSRSPAQYLYKILGMGTYKVKNGVYEVRDHLMKMVMQLEKRTAFKQTRYHFIVEGKPGTVAIDVYNTLRDICQERYPSLFSRIIVEKMMNKGTKSGVDKSQASTEWMASHVKNVLLFHRVAFAKDFIVGATEDAHAYVDPHDYNTEDEVHYFATKKMLQELRAQMLRFRYVYSTTHTWDNIYNQRHKLTGKRGSSEHDDLLISFLMVVYWSSVLMDRRGQLYGTIPGVEHALIESGRQLVDSILTE